MFCQVWKKGFLRNEFSKVLKVFDLLVKRPMELGARAGVIEWNEPASVPGDTAPHILRQPEGVRFHRVQGVQSDRSQSDDKAGLENFYSLRQVIGAVGNLG